MIATLLAKYGYLAVFAGTFLEGETVLVLAGYAAHQGYMHIGWVLVAAFAGSTAGDQTWFHVGRRWGVALLARRASWQARRHQLDERLEKNRDWLVVISRFLVGLRIVTPIVLGTTSIPTWRFVALNLIGALGWAGLFGGLGWTFGAAVERWMHKAEQAQLVLLGGLVLVLLAAHWWRKRRAKHHAPARRPSPDVRSFHRLFMPRARARA